MSWLHIVFPGASPDRFFLRGMGRETNTILAFLLGLTCLNRSEGKRYADRDPSTFFFPTIEEKTIHTDGGMEDRSTQGRSMGFKKAAYNSESIYKKKVERKRPEYIARYDAESIYVPDDGWSGGEVVEDISEPIIAYDPSPPGTQPIKGILRLGPRPVNDGPKKKVTFMLKPKVVWYNPRDRRVRQDQEELMSGFQKCGGGECPDVDTRPKLPPLKPTRMLKEQRRHLFYQ